MERRSQEENEEMTTRAWSTSTASPREQRLFRLFSQESEKSSASTPGNSIAKWEVVTYTAYFTRSTVSFLNPKSVINLNLRQKTTQAIVSPLSYWQTRGEKDRKSLFSCFSLSRTICTKPADTCTRVTCCELCSRKHEFEMLHRASRVAQTICLPSFPRVIFDATFSAFVAPSLQFFLFSRKAPILKSHVYKTSCDFRYRCTFSDKTCTFALSFKHIRNPCENKLRWNRL